MPDSRQLGEMHHTDIKDIDINTLADIRCVQIDPSMPVEERMLLYLSQVGNPYCFSYEQRKVKLQFAEDGKLLEDMLREHLLKMRAE